MRDTESTLSAKAMKIQDMLGYCHKNGQYNVLSIKMLSFGLFMPLLYPTSRPASGFRSSYDTPVKSLTAGGYDVLATLKCLRAVWHDCARKTKQSPMQQNTASVCIALSEAPF